MLSLLGRGARRCLRNSEGPPVLRQSRLLGTSDLSVYGYDEVSPRQCLHHIEEGGRLGRGMAQQPSTAGGILRMAILGGKWGELSLPLKAAEVFGGFKQAAAGRLQHWASPQALCRASSLVLPGFYQPVPLPRCREHSDGYDDDAEEFREDGAEGLFDRGLWATSVRRKRVTKMRKHKWRKRRKLQRQSASRRVNK